MKKMKKIENEENEENEENLKQKIIDLEKELEDLDFKYKKTKALETKCKIDKYMLKKKIKKLQKKLAKKNNFNNNSKISTLNNTKNSNEKNEIENTGIIKPRWGYYKDTNEPAMWNGYSDPNIIEYNN